MTGYGRADTDGGVSVELRTVNHRFLDISCRLPRSWAALEAEIKAEVGRHIRRGRVELGIRIERGGIEGATRIDTRQAERYRDWAHEFAGAEGPVLDVARLLTLPGVIVTDETPPEEAGQKTRLLAGVRAACQAAAAMRREEGDALEREISSRLDAIEQAVARLTARVPAAALETSTRLKARIAALCAEVPVDAARIAQEVAIMAERADVTEEVARLASHISQFRSTVREDDPVGRTLDFLLVEMNREANTIGSKCQDAPMVTEVVFIKSEIEKIREQVQNVE